MAEEVECAACGDPICWLEDAAGRKIPVDAESIEDLRVDTFTPARGHTDHRDVCEGA